MNQKTFNILGVENPSIRWCSLQGGELFVPEKKSESSIKSLLKLEKKYSLHLPLTILGEMYLMFSPSFNEGGLINFVTNILDKNDIEYYKDEHSGAVYNFNAGIDKPLLSAHLDQVQGTPCVEVRLTQQGFVYGLGADGSLSGLGADDKNGVFIVLELLLRGYDVNFCFSCGEEQMSGAKDLGVDVTNKTSCVNTGCDDNEGYNDFLKDDCEGFESFEIFEDYEEYHEDMDGYIEGSEIRQPFSYAIVFDRKGASDVLGYRHGYWSRAFQTMLKPYMNKYGFEESEGIWSDADHFSTLGETINVSVGYYNPHSKNEITVISDLLNTINFTADILGNIDLSL